MQKDNFTSFLLFCTFCAMNPFLQHLRKNSNFLPPPPLVILLYANVSLLEMTDLEGREVWPYIVKKEEPVTSLDTGFVAP